MRATINNESTTTEPLPKELTAADATVGLKSEYDQEMPQSHTTDPPMEPRGRMITAT